jgi:thymidine kinase
MAKLYYNYSAMNAGKSAQLLQAAHNYESNGAVVEYYNFAEDMRFQHDFDDFDDEQKHYITSRIGLKHEAIPYDNESIFCVGVFSDVSAIFIDECQFLTEKQVFQLGKIVDESNVPVICYGIRNDYIGNLFPGSAALLCHADEISEIKAMCSNKRCNKKATHIALYEPDGKRIIAGEQIQIGDSEYRSLCRKHFYTNEKNGYQQ